MGVHSTASEHGFRVVQWKFAGIVTLLVVTTLAIIPISLSIINSRQSEALVIDLAGRQRMLLDRHMRELLLASQGVATQHHKSSTRDVLRARLEALTDGGRIVAQIGGSKTALIPPAPTDATRQKLQERTQRLNTLIQKADAFLRIPQGAPEYLSARDELLREHAALPEIANDAVTLLAQHAEANIHSMIGWEVTFVLVVVTVGALLTWRLSRSHTQLEAEIAERKRAERALQHSQAQTLQALRQSDALKSALLSSVSHELRTPLTAIKSMLFSLQSDDGLARADIRHEFIQSIDEELDYLNRLVNNLLDMSRIEAGALVPHRGWHLIEELVEGAIRRAGQRLQQRSLQVDLAPNLVPIFVDGVQIQQVLINLLDNAVKYSHPDSGIRIHASRVAEIVEVRVSNNGEGIPSEDLHRIFDRFYRVRSARDRSVPGSGLGLAICKGIIEAHGGRIMAQSSPGHETTILFRLPLTTEHSLDAPTPASVIEHGDADDSGRTHPGR